MNSIWKFWFLLFGEFKDFKYPICDWIKKYRVRCVQWPVQVRATQFVIQRKTYKHRYTIIRQPQTINNARFKWLFSLNNWFSWFVVVYLILNKSKLPKRKRLDFISLTKFLFYFLCFNTTVLSFIKLNKKSDHFVIHYKIKILFFNSKN